MRIAVIRFPGSNCDQDAFHALRDELGLAPEYVWHEQSSLAGFDGALLPGGFSYGDYLRCGAMASRSPVVEEVRRMAAEGRPVAGICNGFQVLCEAGILPGALMKNEGQKFICRDVYLSPANRTSIWTREAAGVLRIPIAHGEGRYVCEPDTLELLRERDLIAFRYCSPEGELDPEYNFNGSVEAIAGVLNRKGNVIGMMPHPERATREELGGADGKVILNAFAKVLAAL